MRSPDNFPFLLLAAGILTVAVGCCPPDSSLVFISPPAGYASETQCLDNVNAQCDDLKAEAVAHCEEYCADSESCDTCVPSLTEESSRTTCSEPQAEEGAIGWMGRCVHYATCECTCE